MNPTVLIFPRRVSDGGRGGDVSFSWAADSIGTVAVRQICTPSLLKDVNSVSGHTLLLIKLTCEANCCRRLEGRRRGALGAL